MLGHLLKTHPENCDLRFCLHRRIMLGHAHLLADRDKIPHLSPKLKDLISNTHRAMGLPQSLFTGRRSEFDEVEASSDHPRVSESSSSAHPPVDGAAATAFGDTAPTTPVSCPQQIDGPSEFDEIDGVPYSNSDDDVIGPFCNCPECIGVIELSSTSEDDSSEEARLAPADSAKPGGQKVDRKETKRKQRTTTSQPAKKRKSQNDGCTSKGCQGKGKGKGKPTRKPKLAELVQKAKVMRTTDQAVKYRFTRKGPHPSLDPAFAKHFVSRTSASASSAPPSQQLAAVPEPDFCVSLASDLADHAEELRPPFQSIVRHPSGGRHGEVYLLQAAGPTPRCILANS